MSSPLTDEQFDQIVGAIAMFARVCIAPAGGEQIGFALVVARNPLTVPDGEDVRYSIQSTMDPAAAAGWLLLASERAALEAQREAEGEVHH